MSFVWIWSVVPQVFCMALVSSPLFLTGHGQRGRGELGISTLVEFSRVSPDWICSKALRSRLGVYHVGRYFWWPALLTSHWYRANSSLGTGRSLGAWECSLRLVALSADQHK
ncbi:hypothetical protein U1Q18_037071 [Sarracenia purpurea var. burkii]